MNRPLDRVFDVTGRIAAAAFACAFAAAAVGCFVWAYHDLLRGYSFLSGAHRTNPPLDRRVMAGVIDVAFAIGLFMVARGFARVAWRRRTDPLGDDPFAPPTCRACGYDLRATPRRCPECGADAGFAEPDEASDAGKQQDVGGPRPPADAGAE